MTVLFVMSMSDAVSRMYKALDLWKLVSVVDNDNTIDDQLQYMTSMADEWQQKIKNLLEQLQLLVPDFRGTLRIFNKRDSEIRDDQTCSSDDEESCSSDDEESDDDLACLRSEYDFAGVYEYDFVGLSKSQHSALLQAHVDEWNCAKANEDLEQASLTMWSTQTMLDQASEEYNYALSRLAKCELSSVHQGIRDDCMARRNVILRDNMRSMTEILRAPVAQDHIPVLFIELLRSDFHD